MPPRGLLPEGRRRVPPHIYTADEIAALMHESRRLRPPLRAATMETVLGLLVVTGIRSGEAVRLNRDDVDLVTGRLRVVATKYDKSRELALHPTAVKAMQRYQRLRDRHWPRSATVGFFVSGTGRRLSQSSLEQTFAELVRRAGLEPEHAVRGPMIMPTSALCRCVRVVPVQWGERGATVGITILVVVMVSFLFPREGPLSRVSGVLMAGPLAPFAGVYELELEERGYTPLTSVNMRRQMARLSGWLTVSELTVADLTSDRVVEFLTFQRDEGSYRSQRSRPGLLLLLKVLRRSGVLAADEPMVAMSPSGVLLAAFEKHLLIERGLAVGTARGYVRHADRFVSGLRSGAGLDGLTARDVTAAVLRESGRRWGAAPTDPRHRGVAGQPGRRGVAGRDRRATHRRWRDRLRLSGPRLASRRRSSNRRQTGAQHDTAHRGRSALCLK